MSVDLARVAELMDSKRWGEALPLLRQAIDDEPTDWARWYMAGQCCRFTDDLDGAIRYLTRAAELKSDESGIFQGLATALQRRGRLNEAGTAYGRALEIDPEYVVAYIGLALTQQLTGDLDKAVHNYDSGLKALARRIAKSMRNDRSNPILEARATVGQRWIEQAAYGALWLVSVTPDIETMAWPTDESAREEERGKRHEGLYWVDEMDLPNKGVRLFLPNYFNTFQEQLRRNRSYSDLVGHRGTALELLGNAEEAQQHFQEATEFLPEN